MKGRSREFGEGIDGVVNIRSIEVPCTKKASSCIQSTVYITHRHDKNFRMQVAIQINCFEFQMAFDLCACRPIPLRLPNW